MTTAERAAKARRHLDQRFQTAGDLLHGLRQGLATLAPRRSQSLLSTTERGSWLDRPVGPTPARGQTLVTNITPTPVSQPPAGGAPPLERTVRVVAPAARETGPSVGPVTHTAELPQPALRRRTWLYAAGSSVLAVALFGTAALAGTSVAYLQGWYPRQTSSDSGGG